MAGTTWGIGKAGGLPLRDAHGYMMMLQQVASKDTDKIMVFVSLPPSFGASKKGQASNKENEVAEVDERRHIGTMYEKKVSVGSGLRTCRDHLFTHYFTRLPSTSHLSPLCYSSLNFILLALANDTPPLHVLHSSPKTGTLN